MSKRFRDRRGIGKNAPTGATVAANSNDTGPLMDDAELMGGTSDLFYEASGAFPVQREVVNQMADAYVPQWPSGLGDAYDDKIDHEVGGVPGQVGGVPYSMGVVDTTNMENFALTGEQAVIRRPRNPSAHGPVATADHNTLVGLALAQSASQFYPNERSQADIVRSV